MPSRFYSGTTLSLQLCLFVGLSLGLMGCSVLESPSPITTASKTETARLSLRTLTIPGISLPKSINPELLELDIAKVEGMSKEFKALVASLAWMEKSEEQSRVDLSASLASALRAAQTSLEPLLPGNQCQDRISFECDYLLSINRKVTHYIIGTLHNRSWIPPSMAASRYQLSEDSKRNITLLRSWETTISATSDHLHIDRPGLGMPFFGCRSFKKQTRICSPLTAVLSFLNPLNSDSIVAELLILDTYQQEVYSIEDTLIPLAATFALPIESLIADSVQSSVTLRCLSTPTSSTGLLLLLQQPNQSAKELETFLQSVSLNPSVRDSYTPCLASVDENLSIQASAKLAKRITRAMQRLLRDTFSTKASRLALVNLTPETLPLSTLLTTSLSTANPRGWEVIGIGVPPFRSALAPLYDTLEDTARHFSVELFTTRMTCDSACEDVLNPKNHDSTRLPSDLDRSPITQRQLPEGSFTVSPTM